MKSTLLILALLALSGCASLQKVQRITQDVSGDATIAVETFLNKTDIVVKNARQEDGFYLADVFEADHRGKWSKTSIRIRVENYKRPLIGDEI